MPVSCLFPGQGAPRVGQGASQGWPGPYDDLQNPSFSILVGGYIGLGGTFPRASEENKW